MVQYKGEKYLTTELVGFSHIPALCNRALSKRKWCH